MYLRKVPIETGKLEPHDMSSTTEMNCIYEGELIGDTVSSFQNFHFSLYFPACLSSRGTNDLSKGIRHEGNQ